MDEQNDYKIQIPFLRIGSICLFLMYLVFALLLLAGKSYLVGFTSLALAAFYIIAIILFKVGRVKTASNLSTISTLLMLAIVHYLGTYNYDVPQIIHRNALFLVTMLICNQTMAVSRKQSLVFMIGAAIIWVTGSPFAFANAFKANKPLSISTMFIATGALATVYAMSVAYTKYLKRLIEVVAEQSEKSEKAFNKVKNAVEESKEGLNVGYVLKEQSNKATENSNKISELSVFLKGEASNLMNQVKVITNENQSIVEASMEMKAAVEEQNASTSNTSAALNEISANLSSISRITENRKEGLNEVVRIVESQGTLLNDLVEKIKKLEESCNQIGVFVKTVNEIQSQTNILAMNASIEAAHAGEAGKGFSVIAQEVRKLSEETSKNAALIENALKLNNELVKATTAATDTFIKYSEKSASEITNTVRSIDEIVSGIGEVDLGTQDIMRSLNEIVAASQDSNKMVQNVVDSIHVQNDSVSEIDEFVKTLSEKVDNLNLAIEEIVTAVKYLKMVEARRNMMVCS